MRHLDLFSGIGGFALAARWVGWETVGFCEIDPYCRKVLEKNFTGISINEDITHFRPTQNVDMVTAGFPCQDVSLAGQGAGLSGDRSGLFWYIIRTLRMVGRPKLLLENVAALLIRGMGTVLGALAQIGYDTEWDCISAASLGANHRRDRTYILAYLGSQRMERIIPQEISEQPVFSWCKDGRRIEDLPKRCNLYESRLCSSPNGISKEVGAYGNAIVPQIAEIIFRAIDNERYP